MIVEEPPFYGSWKGRVLEAIAVENIRDWVGILDYTQLTRENLNFSISELYRLDIIEKKEDGLYWIKDIVLLHQYRSYFDIDSTEDYKTPLIQHEEEKKITLEKALPKDENLANFVVKWRAFKNLSFSLDARHFFLEGTYLDDLSKDLIRQARKEVLIVNPFVEECHLSNTLIDAIANKAKVIVITRNPSEVKHDYRQDIIKEKVDYLETLKREGITIHYDRRIHAKLLVVDEQIAVISSMNFYSTSSGGSSWEAGMISVDDAIVSSVHTTIYQLLKKF